MAEHAGWRSRGYLPHCDGGELVQHVVWGTIGEGEGIKGFFGARFLSEPQCAESVEKALLHFDGERYRLLAWCVMPNHVHVVVEQVAGGAIGQSRACVEVVHGARDQSGSQAQWRGLATRVF